MLLQALAAAGIKAADTVVLGTGRGDPSDQEADARVLAALLQVSVSAADWAGRPARTGGVSSSVLLPLRLRQWMSSSHSAATLMPWPDPFCLMCRACTHINKIVLYTYDVHVSHMVSLFLHMLCLYSLLCLVPVPSDLVDPALPLVLQVQEAVLASGMPTAPHVVCPIRQRGSSAMAITYLHNLAQQMTPQDPSGSRVDAAAADSDQPPVLRPEFLVYLDLTSAVLAHVSPDVMATTTHMAG
jgi:hypothetical protein